MEVIRQFANIQLSDGDLVGGKNASLGEMIRHLAAAGINVPDGFAITTDGFKLFLCQDNLNHTINSLLAQTDINDLNALAHASLQIRNWIQAADFPQQLIDEIINAFQTLTKGKDISVAVRSSATAEDLPGISFAGQQESYLNVKGVPNLLLAIKKVYASLYNERAIAYRVHNGFDHSTVSISVGVQQMVRSDLGASGVIFTLDTESGFDEVVFITASYGLGESVVQGAVNPDEIYVHKALLSQGRPAILRKNVGTKASKVIYADSESFSKALATLPVAQSQRVAFCISDDQVHELARIAVKIENHYQRPMDIEWALDGTNNELYIVQARPETVNNKKNNNVLERFKLLNTGQVIAIGRSIGDRLGQGQARVILNPSDKQEMQEGEVLVTDMTDPDWEPVMKRAAAIVTNRGGRTCHAAIIARELGIPAVVGCGDVTDKIHSGEPLTASCGDGESGTVYSGLLPYEIERVVVDELPTLPLKLYMNLGNPEKAFAYQAIPNDGIGLARLEFIINNNIGVHPRALLEYRQLDQGMRDLIAPKIAAYSSPVDFYIEKVKEGISTLAAAFYPRPVIVRFSDFKSNEYANLVGGLAYEPIEENPMIGYRGASRYISKQFRDCFELECRAIKKVRDEMGLTNVKIMVPFVRKIIEAKKVIELLNEYGLKSGVNDLEIYMMCEVPSNALLAEDFLHYFDGFSIGSNDLTQLTLGLDRDSSWVADLFDERDKAVKTLLHQAISACLDANKYIGICGQGPSDHPDFASWLVQEGISSISLSPDTLIKTWLYLSEHH